ncbi:MAG: phosphoenolpyruvate--protein phosphotransferase [Clostridiales bacterium GWB2_37_7]|nr:MAG: phosphoenolpyruvate--protein phosphotransferase [Clostridiales bacterium GWB2_37_7]
MESLLGTGVSKGIAIGSVLVKKESSSDFQKKSITDVEHEWDRFQKAIEAGKKQLEVLVQQSRETIGEDEAQIFEAHILILEDEELANLVKTQIDNQKKNTEWAVHEAAEHFAVILEGLEDEYLKERAHDIRDVSARLIRILSGTDKHEIPIMDKPCIIVARDLLPGEMVHIDKAVVMGIITEAGAKTSHTAILAKAMGIPAIVGAEGILEKVKDHDTIVFDGELGNLFINPDSDILEQYNQKLELLKIQKKELESFRDRASITKDGADVELFGNMASVAELPGLVENGAQGIGLFRTEFLYTTQASAPSEEEQFEIYKLTAEKMQGKTVIIRTLDIGGDKEIPYLGLDKEENPFLGCRGIRLCFDKVDIWKVQLRALLRASIFGDIKIMLPMISVIEEVRKAKEIINEVKEELESSGIPFNENLEIGIMIETPAAAMIADSMASEVDFFSIGTNDLIQYTLACDRMNPKISYLYSQFNPSVLRLIKHIIDTGHEYGIKVGMCGEAAGDIRLIPLFVGMGLDEFSMNASGLLEAKKVVTQISRLEMSKVVPEVLKLKTAQEVETYLAGFSAI